MKRAPVGPTRPFPPAPPGISLLCAELAPAEAMLSDEPEEALNMVERASKYLFEVSLVMGASAAGRHSWTVTCGADMLKVVEAAELVSPVPPPPALSPAAVPSAVVAVEVSLTEFVQPRVRLFPWGFWMRFAMHSLLLARVTSSPSCAT
jgi:hypothetical protein